MSQGLLLVAAVTVDQLRHPVHTNGLEDLYEVSQENAMTLTYTGSFDDVFLSPSSSTIPILIITNSAATSRCTGANASTPGC